MIKWLLLFTVAIGTCTMAFSQSKSDGLSGIWNIKNAFLQDGTKAIQSTFRYSYVNSNPTSVSVWN